MYKVIADIKEPLYIEKVEFNKELGEINIYIDFRKGSKFKCCVCGNDDNPVYDTETKVWKFKPKNIKAFITSIINSYHNFINK